LNIFQCEILFCQLLLHNHQQIDTVTSHRQLFLEFIDSLLSLVTCLSDSLNITLQFSCAFMQIFVCSVQLVDALLSHFLFFIKFLLQHINLSILSINFYLNLFDFPLGFFLSFFLLIEVVCKFAVSSLHLSDLVLVFIFHLLQSHILDIVFGSMLAYSIVVSFKCTKLLFQVFEFLTSAHQLFFHQVSVVLISLLKNLKLS
jgi:hypothetical protein